jgi:DNA-binding response OmpR family regulator
MISSKNILIVSNDLMLYKRLESLLSRQDYQAFYAQSTDSRLKTIIKNINPDLIVVDPEMPSLRGISIGLLIRQWSPVPILMLSTVDSGSNELRALNLESGDYLSDPIDVNLVAARIDTILSLSPI